MKPEVELRNVSRDVQNASRDKDAAAAVQKSGLRRRELRELLKKLYNEGLITDARYSACLNCLPVHPPGPQPADQLTVNEAGKVPVSLQCLGAEPGDKIEVTRTPDKVTLTKAKQSK